MTFVAEHEGQVTHFGSARLVFLVEPLKALPGVKISKNAQRRAVYGIAKALEGWISDREKNRSGVYTMFAHVAVSKFQQLCEAWGMSRWYPKARLYGKEL